MGRARLPTYRAMCGPEQRRGRASSSDEAVRVVDEEPGQSTSNITRRRRQILPDVVVP